MNESFIKAKNCYSYPPIGLDSSKALKDVGKWKSAFHKTNFDTTINLDCHHFNKLTSDSDDDVRLGIYSVMYWGNVSAGAKSITRCDWISVGNKKNSNLSIQHIGIKATVQIVRSSVKLVRCKKYDEALLKITELPHVGVSFGTKFLAFIDPENIGILDEKITNHLSKGTFGRHLLENEIQALQKRKNENKKAASKRFCEYCQMPNKYKSIINKGDSSWKDLSGAEKDRFRAIDIERALFVLAKYHDQA